MLTPVSTFPIQTPLNLAVCRWTQADCNSYISLCGNPLTDGRARVQIGSIRQKVGVGTPSGALSTKRKRLAPASDRRKVVPNCDNTRQTLRGLGQTRRAASAHRSAS